MPQPIYHKARELFPAMAFLPPHPPTRAVGMALTILLSFVACAFFVASSLFSVDGQQQQQTPLLLKDGTLDLIYEYNYHIRSPRSRNTDQKD